jgi:hypothetical protein
VGVNAPSACWIRAELAQDGRGHVGRGVRHEEDGDALRANEAGGELDLLEQRIRRVVEQEVCVVEEERE